MNSFSKIGLAVLAGITAGLVTGILLAPEEGANIRKKLAKKARKYEDMLKEKGSYLEDRVKEKSNQFKNKASDFASKVETIKGEAQKAVEQFG